MAVSGVVKAILDRDKDPEILLITNPERQFNGPIFKFCDIPLIKNELLKGLHQELDLKRPSRLEAEYMGVALVHPYDSVLAQCRPRKDKMRSYCLSVLFHLRGDDKKPQGLIVVENNDAARKVYEVVTRMGAPMRVTSEILTNNPNHRGSRLHSQVVIGTPTCVLKWMKEGQLPTSDIKVIVYDDCVWKENAISIMERIKKNAKTGTAPEPQVLIFASCLTEEVRKNSDVILKDRQFNKIFVNEEEYAVSCSCHLKVGLAVGTRKEDYAEDIVKSSFKLMHQIIIYGNPETVRSIYMKGFPQLASDIDYICPEMHTDEAGEQQIDSFKEKSAKILLTSRTDIDWRYDPSNVQMVMNVDFPMLEDNKLDEAELYKRISRAGRRGEGLVLYFIENPTDMKMIDDFEEFVLKRTMMEHEPGDDFSDTLTLAGFREELSEDNIL